MQTSPLVSIIIPVYNGANFLKKAIDSALNQTYQNIEILVINDGSADGGETEKIALTYGNKIRYLSKENGGVSSALNLGIKEMRGDYFSWLSHDDEYTPTKIESQVIKIKDGADIIVCSERQIDKNSNFLSSSNDHSALEKSGVVAWDEEAERIIKDKLFSGCALLIPKYVFDKVGLFDEELRYNQDFDLWLRICFAQFSWVYHNDVGVLSRVHNNQVTQTRRDLFYTDSFRLGKRLIPVLAEKSTCENNLLYQYTKQCAKYNLAQNVHLGIQEMRKKNLYSLAQSVSLTVISFYGKLRPTIRKIYYMLFKNVKTN